ncbi:MAG: hypothetical protein ACI8Z1_002002 [Candidatus Azotimanducaceae bacterium]|jgi:hypothetical protein
MRRSIYLAGLEDMTVAFSCSQESIDNAVWVDPDVVDLLGITEEELRSYRQPVDFEDQGGLVPQPRAGAAGPRLNYSPEAYKAILAQPDENFLYSVTTYRR